MHERTGSWLPVFGTAVALDITAAFLALLVLKPWRQRYIAESLRTA